jgi:hypothetical protein
MFLTKDKKSSYFQIIYFTDGKRTKKSTKKKIKAEKVLQKFLFDFNNSGNILLHQHLSAGVPP